MLLLIGGEEIYFNDDYDVTFTFGDNFTSFNEFKSVFDAFNQLDNAYQNLKIDLYGTALKAPKRQSYVKSVSKQSPLEIVAFIEQNWFALFLLYLASYRDIKGNISESFKDVDIIIESVESKFRELTADFPNYEWALIKDELKNILIWINLLQVTEKERILKQFAKGKVIFNRLVKLIIKRN